MSFVSAFARTTRLICSGFFESLSLWALTIEAETTSESG